MSHLPVDHPLRPMYRAVAALTGAYLVLFGVVGFVKTSGEATFGHAASYALGLRTNPAFAVLSVIAGVAVLLAFVTGRNLDAVVNLWGGSGFLIAGIGMMAVLRTDLNVLNFSMATCVVSFVIGSLLFSASFYVRSSSAGAALSQG